MKSALFTVTGIGLLPWRIIDTYRKFLFLVFPFLLTPLHKGILQIWKLKKISARLRREAGPSDPYDEDDFPASTIDIEILFVLPVPTGPTV